MDKQFFESIENELINNILPYWEVHAIDSKNPGFYGNIDNENNKDAQCERSIVMTARFLWTYSAAARLTKNPDYLKLADFAYDVITTKYWDKTNGGVYWSILPDGTPKVTKKQIYGEAFACYGLSEYAAALKELEKNDNSLQESPKSNKAMEYAITLFDLLERYAFDSVNGGYIEACAINWAETNDMKLSSKDMNCAKSMNTNLHMMEAYTNLYRNLSVAFPEHKAIRENVGIALKKLIQISVSKILTPNGHLSMFFDMDWTQLSEEISYGHDIEFSWLLWEAACELKDEPLKSQIYDTVLKVAEIALQEGFDHENGCMENLLKDKHTEKDRSRVWWNQAESLNGFYNAWEMTKDQRYANACKKQWNWIQNYQVDKKNGEWWSELDENNQPVLTEAKGGNWKTSYHNGRCCMELLRRSQYFDKCK